MKSCDEMTADVLRRIGEERAARKKKRKLAITGVSVICVCLAVIICIGVLPGSENPAVLVQAADLMEGVVPGEVRDREADDRFIDSQMDFAAELLRAVSADSEGENVLVSPLSVELALAMTANGAKGGTLREMEDVLGGGMSVKKLNEYLHTFVEGLPSEEKAKLEIANSIWFADDGRLAVNRDFLQTNADYYGAAAWMRDFADPATVDEINEWVSDSTDGMIDSIIDKFDPETVMCLINAIVFDAEWFVKFEDEHKDEFYCASGATKTVDMMTSREDYMRYIETDNAVGFTKDYMGLRYRFAALLPNEDVAIGDYIASLTGESLRDALESADRSWDITANVPKFSYDFDASLKEVLSDMGMPTAFSSGADLSRMGESDLPLMIDDVVHKTYISVDVNGTKAAAVTGAFAVQMAGPPETKRVTVTLDRPFVYMIVDTETNLPIFMGAVMEIGE